MGMNHRPPEERDWRRLLRDLEKFPADQWRVFGLLGEPDQYPNSLYKLYVHRGGSAKWWKADFGVGQTPLNPITYQTSIPKENALPADRVVSGDASVLRKLTCDPHKRGVVKLLTEFHQRLSS